MSAISTATMSFGPQIQGEMHWTVDEKVFGFHVEISHVSGPRGRMTHFGQGSESWSVLQGMYLRYVLLFVSASQIVMH